MQRGWQNKNFWAKKHILVIYKSGYNGFQSMVIVKDKIHVKEMWANWASVCPIMLGVRDEAVRNV